MADTGEAHIIVLDKSTWTKALVASVSLFAFGVVLVWRLTSLNWQESSTWLQAGLGLTAAGLSVWQIVQLVNWGGFHLAFSPQALRVTRAGRVEAELPYDSIAGYRVNQDGIDQWLSIARIGETTQLVLPGYSLLSPASVLGQQLTKFLGPRLGAKVVQVRGKRPDDIVQAIAFDHFGEPPEVQMKPGIRYRYVSEESVLKFWDVGGWFNDALSPAGTFILIFREWSSVWGQLISAVALFFCVRWIKFMAAKIVRSCAQNKSAGDSFELVPSGIKVFREGRSWILEESSRFIPTNKASRRLLGPFWQYGRGLRAYFFDPRFIKPD